MPTLASADIPVLHSVSSEVPSAAAITRVLPKNNLPVLGAERKGESQKVIGESWHVPTLSTFLSDP